MKRKLSMLSTAALLPAMLILAFANSLLAAVYAASCIVTLAYHRSEEQRWRKTDHVFAYGVIASNTWMTLHSKHPAWALCGVGFVLIALVAYRDARRNPHRYDASHALWHVLSGFAGTCFALGYA